MRGVTLPVDRDESWYLQKRPALHTQAVGNFCHVPRQTLAGLWKQVMAALKESKAVPLITGCKMPGGAIPKTRQLHKNCLICLETIRGIALRGQETLPGFHSGAITTGGKGAEKAMS